MNLRGTKQYLFGLVKALKKLAHQGSGEINRIAERDSSKPLSRVLASKGDPRKSVDERVASRYPKNRGEREEVESAGEG